MPRAPAAMSVKPSTPATTEMMKKMMAHLSMCVVRRHGPGILQDLRAGKARRRLHPCNRGARHARSRWMQHVFGHDPAVEITGADISQRQRRFAQRKMLGVGLLGDRCGFVVADMGRE